MHASGTRDHTAGSTRCHWCASHTKACRVQSAVFKSLTSFPIFSKKCLPVECPVAPINTIPKDFSTNWKPELYKTPPSWKIEYGSATQNENATIAKNAAVRRNVLTTYVGPNIPHTVRPCCYWPKQQSASKLIPGGAYWCHWWENIIR